MTPVDCKAVCLVSFVEFGVLVVVPPQNMFFFKYEYCSLNYRVLRVVNYVHLKKLLTLVNLNCKEVYFELKPQNKASHPFRSQLHPSFIRP